MAKQYCRYCVHCFEADYFRCSNHPKEKEPHFTEEQIKRENHCQNYILSDMGDVITGRQYKPRAHRQSGYKQMTLEEM